MHQHPEFIRKPGTIPLLPNEPRVLNWTADHALTERFLMPEVSNLEALFLELRTRLDPVLYLLKPVKHGKQFPLGQCLEISLAMQDLLQQLEPSSLEGAPAQGYAALAAFLQHGGTMRQVWGDLRNKYFQNAFLAGTLYIDVSNDTVVRTKPRVEILPFTEAQLSPVEDYVHFARLSASYWDAHIFPNHVLPSLAPYFPLISVTSSGVVRLQSNSGYMIALTLADEFRPSEMVLDTSPMNDQLFRLIAPCLVDSSLEVSADPVQGHAMALQYCKQFRADGWHRSDDRRAVAIKAGNEANDCLTQLKVQIKAS